MTREEAEILVGTLIACVNEAHAAVSAGWRDACWNAVYAAEKQVVLALVGVQPAPSAPNLDMDALERKNDDLKEEVGKLRDALALIADQYEPKCNLLIPSIARSALCATGAYGQTKAQPAQSVPEEEGMARAALASAPKPEGWQLVPKLATPKMISDAANHYESDDYSGPASMYRAMLAAAPKPEAKP